MFKVEIRDGAVHIDGYVNAVERDSKVMKDERGEFIEKVKAGAFQRAIDRAESRNQSVRVLLNHDYARELTSTKAPTTELFEDSIGLRCRCEIRDAEVVQKAKEQKLNGWSFGFHALVESRENDKGIDRRELREIELYEVSLLDDTRTPAYNGTSVEVRDYTEIRDFEDEKEYTELPEETREETEPADLHEYELRFNATRMA
ncbi:MAG: HK97 family phage prohead protease [Lachnospiraceae bacterium]|nr:HK97 family phage prohead protease [Lachnospiraceae bacterium]